MNRGPLDLEAALARVLSVAQPLPGRRLDLYAAAGGWLAEPVHAARTHPAADNAAMDGYAVRSADVSNAGVRLRIVGVSRTGHGPTAAVGEGQAVRIFTGGLLPAGADAVLVQESAQRDGDDALVAQAAVAPGQHVRRAGEEFGAGERLLEPGARLSPAAIGLLASAGVREVAVARPARVALLVIGDELQAGGESLAHRFDSNGPMLAAALADCGLSDARPDSRPDDVGGVSAWLANAVAECDLVLTCGSASVGDHDVIGRAWEQVPVQPEFARVAIKPGKPVRFGQVPRADGPPVLVFALPGNPLACLTGFEQLVAPAIRRLQGGAWRPAPRLRLPLAALVRTGHDALYLLRCGLAEGALRVPARQGTAMLREAATQPLVARLPGGGTLAAGTGAEATALPGALDGLTLQPVGALPVALSVRASGSGVGKTLLIEALLAELSARGLRLGSVKHAHHALEPDTPGKDTFRHFAAGASRVLLLAPGKSVLYAARATADGGPVGWLEQFAGEADLVLIEGFRNEPLPAVRVEVGAAFDWRLEPDTVPVSWVVTRPGDAAEGWRYPPALVSALAESLIAELQPG